MADLRPMHDRAATQLGLVTRADLVEAGISRPVFRRLVASGTLVARGRRTFAVAAAPRDERQQVLAACLDTGGVASHRTSAWLHGLDGFERLGTPEVVLRRQSYTYGRSDVLIHTTTNLPADDLVRVGPIPSLGVARTLLTLAALGPEVAPDRLRGAVDGAVQTNLATDPWLWWRLERVRCRGRNGVSAFEEILTARAAGEKTESWLERATLRLFRNAGIPLPTCQRRVAPDGAFVARVDFCDVELMIVIEVAGQRWHASKVQVQRDASRRRKLVLAGYLVLDFTYDDIVQRPEEVVAQVCAARRARTVA